LSFKVPKFSTMNSHRFVGATLLFLAAGLLPAQTATWAGPVATNPAANALWSPNLNWSTNVPPSGSTATAVFHDGVLGDPTSPLRAAAVLNRDTHTDLAGIRFESAGGSDTARVWPEIVIATTGRHDVMLGDGLAVPLRAPHAPVIRLEANTSLTFVNSARISGVAPVHGGAGHTVQIRAGRDSRLLFSGQSDAGYSELLIHQGAQLSFSANSRAGTALILGGGRTSAPTPGILPSPDPAQPDSIISFVHQASLDRALIRTGGRVEFHDEATAGSGFIQSSGEVWFYGRSTSGQMMGGGNLLVFTDQARGGGRLSGNHVEFRQQANADRVGSAATWCAFAIRPAAERHSKSRQTASRWSTRRTFPPSRLLSRVKST
jgi:hypothetical protein